MSCARVLAHDFLQSVGLNRGQRSIAPLQEAREPISKPCLAPHIDLGLERIEARGAPRPHGRIAAAERADGHLHPRAIVEYEYPRTCPPCHDHQESRQDGFAGAGTAEDQRVPTCGLAIWRALFVEVEAKTAALWRREECDRHAPGDFPPCLSERGAVEGSEIGEVVVRDRCLAASRPGIAGMLCHEMRPCPEGFRDQVDPGSGGDVADFGRDVVKRRLGAGIDGHGHVVLAEDQAFGFQIVLGEFQLLREADSPVVGGLHEA